MPRIRTIVVAALVAVVAFVTPALSQTISWTTLAAEVGSGLQTTTQRVRLSDSQHGGVTMRIESADTLLALVTDDQLTPGTAFVDIFVPNGAIDATFFVQAFEDTAAMAHLLASAPGFATSADSIDVVAPALRMSSLAVSHDPFRADDPFTIAVGVPNLANTSLSATQKVRVGGPGLTVTLTNSSAPTAQLVTTALSAQVVSVSISPGDASSPSSVATGGVAFDGLAAGTTDVDATIPGFTSINSVPQTVTVTAPVVTFSTLASAVGSGLQQNGQRARLSGSQHGGVTMHLESSDSNLVLLALGRYDAGSPSLDVFVADGATDVVFYIQALEDTLGSVVLTAAAPGFATGIDGVDVVAPYFRLAGLGSSIDTLDPNDTFWITMGLPNGPLTAISVAQEARGGGPGVVWTVTSSVDTVGLLETTTTLNDSATVYIAPGQASSSTSVVTGGVAFDGVGAGVSQVTASHPGFAAVSNGIVDVTVTQPTISFSNWPSIGVGAGLQPTTTMRANLSASQHGGITVHIETPDTHLALISENAATVGGSSLDVFLANGQTQVQFYIQGIEDTTGTVNLTVSAPGYVDGFRDQPVVQPSVRITSLAGTIDTIDPPDPFVVSVGVANSVNFFTQNVRAGSPGVVVTSTLDDSLVAELQTLADTSDVEPVTIPAGASQSASTVAAGGIAFNGLSPGVVTVTPSTPGFALFANGARTVTVEAPTLTISQLGDTGAGLQNSQDAVTLSASNHGGVTIHIESLEPDLALLSSAVSSPGQASVDVFVANGSATATFWVHGMDDTTGTYTVTATAPFFISDTDSGDVVVPGIEIASLSSSIDVIDPPDVFTARVGLPSGSNSDVNPQQDRRAGAPPLAVTVISSNGAAAEIVKTGEADDTLTVLIPAGTSSTPSSIAAGGVGLDGVASGQTLVTVAVPGFITVGNGQKSVDVTNQNIFINGLTTRLGWSLQSLAAAAELGETGHGGTTLHIEVSDTSLALISGNALVEGGVFIDVFLPNGGTETVFYLQARDNVTGQVTVTVSATGFPTAMQDVDIVAAGLEIFELADSLASTDPDDEFVVRVGAVNADSSGIHEAQALRGGGPSRTLTIASSNGNLAFIVLGNNLGQSRQYVMDPGEFETPLTVAQDGLALTPWNVGQLNVTASTPDFVTTDAGMPLVTITGTPTGIGDTPPVAFALEQNIPNPFNPTTTINFSLPAPDFVDLTVYDVTGRRVARLVNRQMPAGTASVQWNGLNDRGNQVPSGVYFYRLVAGSQVETRKMVLLK